MDINKEILLKYIKGDASEQVRHQVEDWIIQSKENKELYNKIKADYVFDTMPYSAALGTEYSRVKKHIVQSKSSSKINILVKIAAILFIPLCIYNISLLSTNQLFKYRSKKLVSTQIYLPEQTQPCFEYVVNPGVKGKIILPDSSEVWLNSSSKVICPSEFDSTQRILELSGEAYFKVKHNSNWPMYIKTPKGVIVKVLGTEFNMSAYDNDLNFKLTLVSGKVELLRQSESEVINVRPMEQILIPDNKNIQGKIAIADISYDTAWKEGYLVFDNSPISKKKKKMERWFGVHISVKDANLLDYNFTARFNSESLTQVLELMKISSKINYSIDKNNVALYL